MLTQTCDTLTTSCRCCGAVAGTPCRPDCDTLIASCGSCGAAAGTACCGGARR